MKHRISATPIAGTSAALLLLVLAALLFLRGTDESPEKQPLSPAPPDTGLPAGPPGRVEPAVQDTLASQVRPQTFHADKQKMQPAGIPADGRSQPPHSGERYARTGVSFRWAGGKMRMHIEGEPPKVPGLAAKTTLVLEATVSTAGRVTRVSVLSGGRNRQLLDRTVEAVRGWRFERQPPGRKPGAERCSITITYTPPSR